MTVEFGKRHKNRRKRGMIFHILFLVSFTIFLFSVIQLLQYGIGYRKGKNEYKELEKYASQREEIVESSAFLVVPVEYENTFVYGHNMKDKTMFGKLNGYAKEEFYKENPYFYIYVPGKCYRYEIFSCYLADVENDLDFCVAFETEEQFQEFLENVEAQALYNTGVDVTTKDKVVTLMTCNSAGYEYRFLVHAVRSS